MFGAKSGVWWRKAFFLGVKRGVVGIMGCFRVQMGCFWANRCVGAEKGCRGILGYIGVFWAQMGYFQVFEGVRGVSGRKGMSTT